MRAFFVPEQKISEMYPEEQFEAIGNKGRIDLNWNDKMTEIPNADKPPPGRILLLL